MLDESRGIATRTAELVGLAREGDRLAYDRLFALAADKVLFFIRMRLSAGTGPQPKARPNAALSSFWRRRRTLLRIGRDTRPPPPRRLLGGGGRSSLSTGQIVPHGGTIPGGVDLAPLREELEPLDVLQETYLEAHRSFARFDPRGAGSFSRWLCRIAARAIAGLADRSGASKRRAPGQRRSLSGVLEGAAGAGVDPAEIAARREEIERLERAMAALDDEERRALLLRYFEEETIEEMAASLERSPTAARRLLGRATAHLGERLEEARR